jgi:serine/threonine-protein kinase
MSDAAPGVGSRFGPYLLKRLLGRGGMGEVYEADDTVMKRIVALKLMSATCSMDPDFRKRLQREARIAGRLREPHVVPIHDYGEIDGQLYVDMHFIEGTDLDTLLGQHGPLAAPRAVAIVRQIASALDAAHAAGVLHRDVKPANILLTSDDFAYLVDFGIANAVTEEKLTQLGEVLGTWAYMAPERFRGNDKVTRGADVYALTCVLYECVTGSPPYRGSQANLMIAHLTQPIPRPSWLCPGIPSTFDQVILRGMAKYPDDRYASAGDLARAAHDALSTSDRDRADRILHLSQAASPRAAASPTPQPPSVTGAPTATPAHGFPHAPPFPVGGGRLGPPAIRPSPTPRPTRNGHTPWIWVAASAVAVVAVLGGVGIWLHNRPRPPNFVSEPKNSSTTTTTPATPTQFTTATATPDASDESRLMRLVPRGYKCESENPPFPGALASVGCDVHVAGGSPSINGLIYSLYADSVTLKSSFYELIEGDKLVSCQGATAAPSDWHRSANPSVRLGMIGCGTHDDKPEVVWTNDSNNLIGIAQGDNLDQVYKWWQNNS